MEGLGLSGAENGVFDEVVVSGGLAQKDLCFFVYVKDQ